MSITPKKYTKRPVTVEAIRWTGQNEIAVMQFVGKQLKVSKVPPAMEHDREVPNEGYTVTIPTLEGNMVAVRGDMIIRGVKGEFYPCKPDIFEKTYQPAPEPSEQNEKLTADQVNEAHEALETMYPMRAQQIPRDLFGMVVDFGARFAAQQVEHATAELRKELEKWKDSTKDLANQKGQLLKQLAEAQRQRDEAVIHLREMIGHANSMVSKYRTKEFSEKVQKRVNEAYTFLSRLSSGETKPGKEIADSPGELFAVSVLFVKDEPGITHNMLRLGIVQAGSRAEAVGLALEKMRSKPDIANANSAIEVALPVFKNETPTVPASEANSDRQKFARIIYGDKFRYYGSSEVFATDWAKFIYEEMISYGFTDSEIEAEYNHIVKHAALVPVQNYKGENLTSHA